MEQCNRSSGMRVNWLSRGSILSVLLRLAMFSVLVFGCLSGNAADVQLNGAEVQVATAPATQEPVAAKR
jgi:hypothetical protein